MLHLDPGGAPRRYRIGPSGSPPLEVAAVARRVRLVEAGWETAGFTVIYLLIAVLGVWWSGLGLVTSLGFVLGLAGLTFLWRYAVSEVPAPVVAGADWVGSARGRGSRWVALAELTRIDAGPARNGDADPIAGTTALTLQAADPRYGVCLELALLRTNPALWDLVHRGITRAVAGGAEFTPAARQALRDEQL